MDYSIYAEIIWSDQVKDNQLIYMQNLMLDACN